jgi:hypothetical protein
MAKDLRFQSTPLAEEFDVGDDSDLPGFDQPYSRDDVDAILNSPSGSIEERRDELHRMLNDLRARADMDEAGEYGGLIEDIKAALATLASPSDGVGTPDAYAFDPDDRALAPDEILERAEEERGRADFDD